MMTTIIGVSDRAQLRIEIAVPLTWMHIEKKVCQTTYIRLGIVITH